ncbi:MAG: hypothetical protein WKF54_03680 [Nocardioidaceae bacterium]
MVHGVDYNGNGMYDSKVPAPASSTPTLPAEATDPAVCGVLRIQ